MRVFKWSPSFQTTKETSFVPVWFELPNLPCHLFDKSVLFSIMKAVGAPISVDSATLNLLRPSVARVNVEVDLLRVIPSRIWIEHGDNGDGFWQRIIPENLPSYCSTCFRQGHSQESCNMDEQRLQKQWKVKADAKVSQVQKSPPEKDKATSTILGAEPIKKNAQVVSGAHDPTMEHNQGKLSSPGSKELLDVIKDKKGQLQKLDQISQNNISTREEKSEQMQNLDQTLQNNISTRGTHDLNVENSQMALASPTNKTLVELVVDHSRHEEKTDSTTNDKAAAVSSSSKIIAPEMNSRINEGTSPFEASTWELPNIRIAEDRVIPVEADCVVPYSLPRTESAPLLRIHWLDKEKPKPGIPDMDAHGKLHNLDGGQLLVHLQFEEQVTGQEPQSETPVKTSRYNLRSLSKEEICKIQSLSKNKKKEARRNALEFSYSDSDTHFDID